MRGAAAVAVLCALCAPARAGGRLDYTRDSTACPDYRELVAMVESRLGYDPFERELAIDVRVHLSGERARVEIVDGDAVVGARTVRASAGCVELARAAALAVAIAIDPVAASGRPPALEPRRAIARLSSLPVRGPWRVPTLAVGTATRAEPERAIVDDLFAGAGVVAAVGAAPGAGPGATLRIGVRRGNLSLEVEGRADRSSHRDVGPGRVHASLRFASLVPCAHRGAVAACAVVAAGVLRGRGDDLVDAREVSAGYLATGARLAYELGIAEDLSIRGHVDALGALRRTRLTVSEMEVWTLPAWSAALGVSLVGHFR